MAACQGKAGAVQHSQRRLRRQKGERVVSSQREQTVTVPPVPAAASARRRPADVVQQPGGWPGAKEGPARVAMTTAGQHSGRRSPGER